MGNKDAIIEKIFQTSYFPFLKVLDMHPKILVNLHYTGFLLDWMCKYHPEFLDLLRKLVNRSQVELVGGAFFEPVISVIPDVDISGQTTLLADRVKELFGVEPRGFWTAERAWEPHLSEILSDVNASHTFIDDVSFESVGLSESDCFESYLVESRGKAVVVFPILKKLRYLIPFRSVSSIRSFLKNAPIGGIAVYGDDGEKFGAWPNTFERVYEEGWLDHFFTEIGGDDRIETVRITDYLKSHLPRKRIYLPASTYAEMMQWSIPFHPQAHRGRDSPRDQIPHRGFWRLFLAKYPESARMYSKMLDLSSEIHALGEDRNKEPLVQLWKGQCNDAYWHGIFGGLYAPFLRRITFENLIRAQSGSDKVNHARGENWLGVRDGFGVSSREIQLDSRQLRVVISPENGGGVCELDLKPWFVNLLDTLARRPESYHSQIKKLASRTIGPAIKKKGKSASIHESSRAKEKGLQKLLIYDRYPKFAFLDYLVLPDSKIEDFERQEFSEVAFLPACSYEPEIQKSNQSATVILAAQVAGIHGEQIRVNKRISLSADRPNLSVEYEIQTSGEESLLFLPEINLASLADSNFGVNFGRSTGIVNAGSLAICYEDFTVTVQCHGAAGIWTIPVKTVSLSEEGFESNLQEVSVLPRYPIHSGDKTLRTTINLEFTAD